MKCPPSLRSGSEIHIVVWGHFDTGKPRCRILLDGLRRKNVRLTEIHQPLWRGIEDKSQIHGAQRWITILIRWLAGYPKLLLALIRGPRPDILLVGYPGIIDVFVAALAARHWRIPLVWDMFISLYDTIVDDRRLISRESFAAFALYQCERLAVSLPDLTFMDTNAHANRIESLFRIPFKSVASVWVGAEQAFFSREAGVRTPPPSVSRVPRRMSVLFYGQLIPLHGISTILAAADILSEMPIDWTIIGRGQEQHRIQTWLLDRASRNTRWIEWVDYSQLSDWILSADVCLGIFGTSPKAASVIPNKVFQVLAAGRPLVTRDSPAIRELIQEEPGAVYLIAPGNAESLAGAICHHFEHFFDYRREVRARPSLLPITSDHVADQFLNVVMETLHSRRNEHAF